MNDFSNELAVALALDKSDWKIVKFGDVAFQQKKTVDRENTNLTKYVKGEHMASEDLHLREWGELTDEYLGPAFIREFEEGDILYGSRRTYLRKVAIAHFDGITSNTTFVIKANESKIDKRLLPFVMLSEAFAKHSIRNSKGSVNPYINWKDIADYEFLLPPKNKQLILVELLWAMDDLIEKEIELQSSLEKKLIVCHTLHFNKNHDNMKLGDVIKKTLSGGTPDTAISDFYMDGSIPWLTTKILENHFIDDGEKYITEEAIQSSSAKKLAAGNILAGTRVGVGKFAINRVDMAFSQDVTGLVVDQDKVDVEFLVFQLNSTIFQHKIKPFLRGTTIQGIAKDDLLNLSISVPDVTQQIYVKSILRNINDSMQSLKSKLKSSIFLQKNLINQIF